jgi:hypothetical protein
VPLKARHKLMIVGAGANVYEFGRFETADEFGI